jgi:outer membrane receptor protein involved in Fe transport
VPSDEEPTQEELDPTADESESIIVTGSRIPRPQFEGTIPGSQVTAEQIQARGFTNTLEALNDIPLVGPGASPFGTNGGQAASLGAAFVDLLDLGTNRTLTLVNGRRYVTGNQATLFVAGNSTGSQVDLNTIPTALLDRLDVLTVGGAVAYGSDAIAGVVNAILRDDYDGIQVTGLSAISDEGDQATWRLTAIAGMNFGGGRGNIAASFETNYDAALYGDQRAPYRANYIAPTFFGNGGVRNPNFVPSLSVSLAAGNSAFLPGGSDLVPGNRGLPPLSGGTILVTDPGTVFAATGATATMPQGLAVPPAPTVLGNLPSQLNPGTARPNPSASLPGNTQILPGTPIAAGIAGCSTTLATPAGGFCRFAPSTLPGTTTAAQVTFANQVIAAYAPQFSGQGENTQRINLALALLQQRLPTPREFLAANPNTDLNAFLGSFVPNFLSTANTNPATAAFLPRVANPIRFDASGNVVPFVVARGVAGDVPGTLGGAPNGDFEDLSRLTTLRTGQRRHIGNFFGHYDLTDWLTVYTENQYARVENQARTTLAGGSNSITVTTTENAVLVLNINNPFLDAADRAALLAAGVPANGNFLLSRSNQDIVGDNPLKTVSDTYRTVFGLKGDFGLFGRNLSYDTSFTYGRNEARSERNVLKDVEYALAIDAVTVNGNTVCRSQTLGGNVPLPGGVAALEIVSEIGPDGVRQQKLLQRTVSAEQVAKCVPFNPFGYGQQSQAARDYVLQRGGFTGLAEQYFGQASVGMPLFNLPAGPLHVNFTGDYRKESISYEVDEVTRLGGARVAAHATTGGYVEAIELGAEARIPIFGQDFNIPLFRNLELSPGIRFIRQAGNGDDVRLLNGTLQTNDAPARWDQIWSIAGSWRPIEDITFRGNITRSIRQPSIVELFLGGQTSFVAVADPCSTANINSGSFPATRKANCIAEVVRLGIRPDAAQAANFLASYVPAGGNIAGTTSGSPALRPERGRSWTVGGVFSPRFLPRFQFSADYINVEVRDLVRSITAPVAATFCFDSPSFPDTSEALGTNVCNFFSRETSGDRIFNIANGFNSGYINLGALKVKAINMSGQYSFPLTSLFGDGAKLSLYANAYHLIDYISSNVGDYTDAIHSEGDFSRPEWEVQGRVRYEDAGFFAQWVTNWQSKTYFLSGGVPIGPEVADVNSYKAFALHNASMGFTIGENRRYGFQLTVNNVFDKRYATHPAAVIALLGVGYIDEIGRRYSVQANVRF